MPALRVPPTCRSFALMYLPAVGESLLASNSTKTKCRTAVSGPSLAPRGNRAVTRVLPVVQLQRLLILLLQQPIRFPQRPVPRRLRLLFSTTTTPVLPHPPHQVRQLNRAALPLRLQPFQESITS